MLKESVIPYEEDINCPDLTAVIRLLIRILSVLMIIKHLKQELRIKELLRCIRLKHLFYNIIILLFLQPYTNRNWESQFLLFSCFAAENILKLLKRLVISAGIKVKAEYWHSYEDMNAVISSSILGEEHRP